MKRSLFVLAVAIALGLVAAFAAFRVGHRTSTEDWFRKNFELSEQQARKAADLHKEHQIACSEMCARIEQANSQLAKTVQASGVVTPEIRAAIAKTDTVRTECRAEMLEYYYKIAAMLPPAKKQSYLAIVLPTVLEPGMMNGTDGR